MRSHTSVRRETHLYDLANVNQVGAGQAYLGDPVVQSNANCSGSGIANDITGIAECLTRPNPQYTKINMRGSGASSAYDGLNVKVQMQNLHQTGLSLTGNYTWSHALDELSSTFGDSLQGGSGYIGSLGYTSLADPQSRLGQRRLRCSPAPDCGSHLADTVVQAGNRN